METWEIIVLIFFLILVLVGLGVGIYFVWREDQKKNPPPNNNPPGGTGQTGSTGSTGGTGGTGSTGNTGGLPATFSISPATNSGLYMTYGTVSTTGTPVIVANGSTLRCTDYTWRQIGPTLAVNANPANLGSSGYTSPLNISTGNASLFGQAVVDNSGVDPGVLTNWTYNPSLKIWCALGDNFCLYFNPDNTVSIEDPGSGLNNPSLFQWDIRPPISPPICSP